MNIRNITPYPLYILRTKYSDSRRMGNPIVMPGETVNLPVSIGSFKKNSPEILIRVYKSKNVFYNDNLKIKGGGNNKNIFAEDANFYTEFININWLDNYSFPQYSKDKIKYQPLGLLEEDKYKTIILPNVISGRKNPTMDITVVAE